MANNRNQSFTTYDRDNDRNNAYNRARYCHGAWWFNQNCYCYNDSLRDSHLNGLYTVGDTYYKSICWRRLPGNSAHIKYSEMKIRPM